MTDHLDMTVSIAGIRFRSPILAASSECTSDPSLVRKLSRTFVGGIVTKTYTTRPEYKVRVRPYQFPLKVFGKGYREGDCLYSLAAPHVEDIEPWLAKVSGMAEICHSASLPLIASYFEDPADVSLWPRRAKAFEKAGADLIELNFSCPHTSRLFHLGFDVLSEILSRVKDAVSIPVGVKIGSTLEPLEPFISSLAKDSLDFITAHNAPSGLLVDVEKEAPFGAPAIGGYAMGRAFLPYSLARVVRILKETDVPVIGVGGISGPGDALQYLLCGCALAGLGSALYFRGFDILDGIFHGISDWMKRKHYGAVDDFRGKVLPVIRDPAELGSRERYPYAMPPDCPYAPVVNEEECTFCGRCEKTCIYDVFKIDRDRSRVFVEESKCWSCGFCVGICPTGAIELSDRANKSRVIWKNRGTAASFESP